MRQQLPPTPPSMVARLQRNRDEQAWRDFVDAYIPAVVAYLRSKRLQDADARDITQEVLRSVAKAIGGFIPGPEHGRFRSWLFAIVRSKLVDHWRRAKRAPASCGTDLQQTLEGIPDGADQAIWEQQCKLQLLHWAANQIQREFSPATWEAFRLAAIENIPPREAAKQLGMTVSNVYVCKSRVLARLREVVEQMEYE